MFPIGSKCLRINKSTSSRNTKANWELPQNRKQEVLRNAMPTLRHKNRPAEQAAVRCCRRRLPVRRPALFRIRPAAEVLLRETGHRPYRDTPAGKRPARIRRPQHSMERRFHFRAYCPSSMPGLHTAGREASKSRTADWRYAISQERK